MRSVSSWVPLLSTVLAPLTLGYPRSSPVRKGIYTEWGGRGYREPYLEVGNLRSVLCLWQSSFFPLFSSPPVRVSFYLHLLLLVWCR